MMHDDINKYCRIHAAKASGDHRNVDAEVFSLAADEIERLRAELDRRAQIIRDLRGSVPRWILGDDDFEKITRDYQAETERIIEGEC